MKKFILILIASIGISFYLSAQSAGDYRSVGNGNWNDPTKWETYDGSSWIAASTYPGQNSGTGAVTIKIFHELKLTATVPFPIASLLIEQLNDYPAEGVIVSQKGIVAFSSENPVSLTVSGDVVIHGELKIDDWNGTKTHTLFVGANFEVNTAIYDDCAQIIQMIPANFQTINQDDKLNVVFTGSAWINSGPIGITFQDVSFDGAGFSVTYPVYIKGTATFINGIVGISLADDNAPCSFARNFNGSIVFYDDATVSGASNASYVDGIVAKLGDDPFIFPIGSEGLYSPLTISAPASQSDSVNAVYLRSNYWSSSPIIDPGLFNVSNCEVWGLYPGLNNSLDVTVSWNEASGCGSSPYITNVSEVTLAHLSYLEGWDSHSGSGIGTTTNGSVTWSGVSNSGVFTLGNLGACNPPSGTSVTNISSTSATLTWSAANGAISYDVDYKPYNSGVWISAATATTSTSVNISGLTFSMLYNWRIRTNCSSSSSNYSGGSFVTICGAPSGLSTTNITNSSATLNWVAVAPNVSYWVEYKQSTSTTWITVVTNTQSLSYTLGGLTANSAYDWRVISICNISGGGFAQSSFTTLQGPPPPPPPPPICNDVYETNNTSSQARTISIGSTLSAGISSATDIDWFKITTPNNTNTNLEVTLSNLPADYDLYVYNKSLKLVGSSATIGTSNEAVIYNSNARKATYYIKVVGKNGAYNTSQCYNLLAQAFSSSGRTASHASDPANEVSEELNKQLLYPNPASEFVHLRFNSTMEGSVNVQIFNTTGQLIKQSAIKIAKGYNQVQVPVNDIIPGMYVLRINKGELNMTRKFVIAR